MPMLILALTLVRQFFIKILLEIFNQSPPALLLNQPKVKQRYQTTRQVLNKSETNTSPALLNTPTTVPTLTSSSTRTAFVVPVIECTVELSLLLSVLTQIVNYTLVLCANLAT